MAYSSDQNSVYSEVFGPQGGELDGDGGGLITKIFGYSSSSNSLYDTGTGISVSGIVQKSDGTAMPGTAVVFEDGEARSGGNVSGQFRVSVPPQESALSGEDRTGSPKIDFVYDIDPDGISILREDIGSGLDIGKVVYGSIEGKVTDVVGDPVEEDPVVSETGEEALTGPNGNYSFNAPGGSEVSLAAAGTTGTVETLGGQSSTLDFQYSGLELTLQLPTGDGIPDADVTFQGSDENITTDQFGVALFKRAEVQFSGNLVVYGGDIVREVSSSTGGTIATVEIESGSGFKGSVRDSETGETIGGIDVRVDGGDFGIQKVRPDGSFVSASQSAGVLTLSISREDRRYQRVDIEEQVQEGEVKDVEVEVERKENIGTAV